MAKYPPTVTAATARKPSHTPILRSWSIPVPETLSPKSGGLMMLMITRIREDPERGHDCAEGNREPDLDIRRRQQRQPNGGESRDEENDVGEAVRAPRIAAAFDGDRAERARRAGELKAEPVEDEHDQDQQDPGDPGDLLAPIQICEVHCERSLYRRCGGSQLVRPNVQGQRRSWHVASIRRSRARSPGCSATQR